MQLDLLAQSLGAYHGNSSSDASRTESMGCITDNHSIVAQFERVYHSSSSHIQNWPLQKGGVLLLGYRLTQLRNDLAHEPLSSLFRLKFHIVILEESQDELVVMISGEASEEERLKGVEMDRSYFCLLRVCLHPD